MPEEEIAARVELCVSRLIAAKCKAIVAACNTATGVRISTLRHEYNLPFVGVEPALRPAVRAFPDGKIAVLCTPATAKQKKFARLLTNYGTPNVSVLPQPHLAKLIEKNFYRLDTLRGEVKRILRTEPFDAVVLGCTHYVFIRYLFAEVLGEDRVFDGNDGTARRLQYLLTENNLLCDDERAGGVVFDTI